MKKKETKLIIKIAAAAFVLFLLIHYWSGISGFLSKGLTAVLPLIIGGIIAYPLNILMSFYERHFLPKSTKKAVEKARTPLCLLFAILSLVAIIALVIALVVPQFISCIKLLVMEIPGAIETALKYLEKFNISTPQILEKLSEIDWQTSLKNASETIFSGMGNVFNVVINTVSSVVSGVTAIVVAFIFAIYLLLGKRKHSAQCTRIMKKFIKEDAYKKIEHIISVIDDSFHKFIVGQCTEAIILGGLCALGMILLRLPYAAMIGAVISFTALIPVVGAFIGGGIGVFLILTESPTKALIFLIFLVILQQIEGNVIYPKVVGSSMGLPAIWVLAAVTIGGGLGGVFGMLLGVPLAGAIYRLLREYLNKTAPKKVKESPTETPTNE
ncbi:MAG: AI-2E family transporter [Clostridia bacterium]|nr:AI-2E family transporter [Clostridia bacterium]